MKSDTMQYKGYTASIRYDKKDDIFVGEVLNTSDSLSFHGRSIEELESSFHQCIDNYLTFRSQMKEKLIEGLHTPLKDTISEDDVDW